jgi:hypothetical protein
MNFEPFKMKAKQSFEKSGTIYPVMQHSPKDQDPQVCHFMRGANTNCKVLWQKIKFHIIQASRNGGI